MEITSSEAAAKYLLSYIEKSIPNSSTRLSLEKTGYPEKGSVHQTILQYRACSQNLKQHAQDAVRTGCGNCGEMAYAAAIELQRISYKGYIAIGQFGINHQFLIVDDLIIDPWSNVFYAESDWKQSINAYGGSIKEGRLKGRLLDADHFELEDEVVEHVDIIQGQWTKNSPRK